MFADKHQKLTNVYKLEHQIEKYLTNNLKHL